jgi:hypothetical protein
VEPHASFEPCCLIVDKQQLVYEAVRQLARGRQAVV